MKSAGISFYFVLYIVAIVTVFVITMERDHLLKERDEDIAHLVELYVKPLELTPYVDTAKYFIEPSQRYTREPVILRARVEGPIEKSDVTFTLVRMWRYDGGELISQDPAGVAVTNAGGDGVLSYANAEEGTYLFEVAGYKQRIVREGDMMKVMIRDTTYSIPYSESLERVDRDTTLLVARVEKSGIDPLELTLSVQEVEENWVLGPPYRKKIFVGGVEDIGRVAFTGQSPGHIERDGNSFVTLVWDNPSLGAQRFVVTGDAGRGLGEKDRSTVDFSVHVVPPAFVAQPPAKGFWGVPYIFDGRISGLNPLDLSVEIAHDGSMIRTKDVAGKDTVIPQKDWKSLELKVFHHGFPIKEHRAAIASPPPPQVRWLRQEIDRASNFFTVSISASDAVNGPVRISMEAQPSGIARIDKLRGTTFTITVDLQTKPTAVFLKLTASDQYGGSTVSTKQFNIPQ
jgi:hypothetical protein